MDPIEKRFAFFGNAVAFAAHIRRPADFQFKAVASSVIPVTGGLAEAVSERQSYRPPNSEADILSFTAASTRATGDYTDPRRAVDFTNGNYADNELSTLTLVEARVSGFKIAIPQDSAVRTFEVEELLARLESTSDRRTPNAFRGLDAVFTNVTVNGNQLKVNTATDVFTQNETLEKLATTYEKNSDFRKQYGSLFYPTGQEQTGIAKLLWKPHLSAELVVATVVTGFTWLTGPEAGKTIPGNRLDIDGIGSIYFGELLIEEEARRLTLLRLQLGSPNEVPGAATPQAQTPSPSAPPPPPPPPSKVGGEGSVCECHSNGTEIPPIGN